VKNEPYKTFPPLEYGFRFYLFAVAGAHVFPINFRCCRPFKQTVKNDLYHFTYHLIIIETLG